MYYAHQTLIHKKTKKLARLNPSAKTAFNWEIGTNTSFIDENGKEFADDINFYQPILDWFGRPIAGYDIKKGEFIDKSLLQYCVSKKVREQKYKEALIEWYDWVLEELDKKDFINNPFADGSVCSVAYKYFKEQIKAKPLFTIIGNEHSFQKTEGALIFKYKKSTYLLDFDRIVKIKLC